MFTTLKNFFSAIPLSRSSLSLIGLFVVLAAIPLTVFIAQQQILNPRAAGTPTCDLNFKINPGIIPSLTLTAGVALNDAQGMPSSFKWDYDGDGSYEVPSTSWQSLYQNPTGLKQAFNLAPYAGKTLHPKFFFTMGTSSQEYSCGINDEKGILISTDIVPTAPPGIPQGTGTPVAPPPPAAVATPIPTAVPTTVPPAAAANTPTPTVVTTLTPTASLTQTPSAGATSLAFSFKLQGVISPQKTHPVKVEVFNVTNTTLIKSGNDISTTFSAGVFTGTFNPGDFTPGTYIVKLTAGNTLRKQIVANIVTGQNTLGEVELISGDLIQNNELDAADFLALVGCLSYTQGATSSNCSNPNSADLNDDGVVDGRDLSILQINFSHRKGD